MREVPFKMKKVVILILIALLIMTNITTIVIKKTTTKAAEGVTDLPVEQFAMAEQLAGTGSEGQIFGLEAEDDNTPNSTKFKHKTALIEFGKDLKWLIAGRDTKKNKADSLALLSTTAFTSTFINKVASKGHPDNKDYAKGEIYKFLLDRRALIRFSNSEKRLLENVIPIYNNGTNDKYDLVSKPSQGSILYIPDAHDSAPLSQTNHGQQYVYGNTPQPYNIYLGAERTIPIYLNRLVQEGYIKDVLEQDQIVNKKIDNFWLRSGHFPFGDETAPDRVFFADIDPDTYAIEPADRYPIIKAKHVTQYSYVLPAINLKLSKINFASVCERIKYNGNDLTPKTYELNKPNKAFIVRHNIEGDEQLGTISEIKDGTKVTGIKFQREEAEDAEEVVEEVSVVIQAKDRAWAKSIDKAKDDETIDFNDVTFNGQKLPEGTKVKVWIEATDKFRITKATNPVEMAVSYQSQQQTDKFKITIPARITLNCKEPDALYGFDVKCSEYNLPNDKKLITVLSTLNHNEGNKRNKYNGYFISPSTSGVTGDIAYDIYNATKSGSTYIKGTKRYSMLPMPFLIEFFEQGVTSSFVLTNLNLKTVNGLGDFSTPLMFQVEVVNKSFDIKDDRYDKS